MQAPESASTPVPTDPGGARGVARRAWRLVPAAVTVGAVAAIALWFTVRDAVPVLAMFHYATPPVVVAIVCLAASALSLIRRRLLVALTNVAMTLVALGVHWTFERFDGTPDSRPDAVVVKGLFWNVQRGRGGWESVARRVAEQDADLVMLVEAGRNEGDADRALEAALPGFARLRTRAGIVILVRGGAEYLGRHSLFGHGRASVVGATVRGREFTTVVADVASNPLRSRKPMLDALEEAVRPLAAGPTIVAGDFNTPRRSAHFDRWRADWTHAFEAVGRGADGTWPAPLPVLCLDHVWTSASLRPLRCELFANESSDHRMIVFEVGLAD